MDIDPQRLISHPLAAGLLGAMIGLKFAPGLSWFERVTNVAAGAACAGYVTPAAAEVFGLVSAPMQSALGFAVGMFGMSVAAALIEAVRAVQWADIVSGWLKR